MKKYIENITISAISSSLESLSNESSVDSILAFLDSRKYDIVGIHNSSEIVIGYVHKDALINNSVNFKPKVISPEEIVSSKMPLINVVQKFLYSDLKFLFIIENDRINGIVTEADLMKQPVRMVFFNILSNFEELITQKLKNCGINDFERKVIRLAEEKCYRDMVNCLKRYKRLKNENRELTYFDTLYLKDKISLCDKYNLVKIDVCKKKKINQFRNKVVHGNDYFVLGKENLEWILEFIQNQF